MNEAARWLSADLSKRCSGVAVWRGSTLEHTLTVSETRRGVVGRMIGGHPDVYANCVDAWRSVLEGAERLVYEAGLGHQKNVTKALSEHRGMVLAVWQLVGRGETVSVHVQTWRKYARQTWGLPFPAHRARAKELAVWLVRRHWGIDVGPDEAEAVLIGHWALGAKEVVAA